MVIVRDEMMTESQTNQKLIFVLNLVYLANQSKEKENLYINMNITSHSFDNNYSVLRDYYDGVT